MDFSFLSWKDSGFDLTWTGRSASPPPPPPTAGRGHAPTESGTGSIRNT